MVGWSDGRMARWPKGHQRRRTCEGDTEYLRRYAAHVHLPHLEERHVDGQWADRPHQLLGARPSDVQDLDLVRDVGELDGALVDLAGGD